MTLSFLKVSLIVLTVLSLHCSDAAFIRRFGSCSQKIHIIRLEFFYCLTAKCQSPSKIAALFGLQSGCVVIDWHLPCNTERRPNVTVVAQATGLKGDCDLGQVQNIKFVTLWNESLRVLRTRRCVLTCSYNHRNAKWAEWLILNKPANHTNPTKNSAPRRSCRRYRSDGAPLHALWFAARQAEGQEQELCSASHAQSPEPSSYRPLDKPTRSSKRRLDVVWTAVRQNTPKRSTL